MGQYYKAFIETNEGFCGAFAPHSYENFSKLTEHSWIGNSFVGAVCEFIRNNPCKVVWCGDYADSVITEEMENYGTLEKAYITCWNNGTEIISDKLNGDMKKGYLCNVAKKLYVDLEHYCSNEWNNYEGWILNPLPLLTALGNGLGGGDYMGIGQRDVGSWAGDEIYYTEELPEDKAYNELSLIFNEHLRDVA